jgi:hypothetical protein
VRLAAQRLIYAIREVPEAHQLLAARYASPVTMRGLKKNWNNTTVLSWCYRKTNIASTDKNYRLDRSRVVR